MSAPVLERVLVLSQREELPQFLRVCLTHYWPKVRVDVYPTAYGLPPPTFDWSPYQFLFVEQLAGGNNGAASEMLTTLGRQHPDIPTVVLQDDASAEPGKRVEGLRRHLDFPDISPKRLAHCVKTMLDPEQRDQAGNDGMPEGSETAAPRTRGTRGTGSGGPKGNVDADPALNVKIPGYDVLRKVADGGMASILLAVRAEDRRQVVLKILRLQEDDNDELLKRFMREYELIGKLEHPNVVRIYERGFAKDFAYIAMEHCPAGDLKSAMGQGLAPARSLRFVRQIAAGLGAVNAIGIVHRDLKPSNVLFKDADNVAIADFGIAKDLTSMHVLTIPGSMLGTPYYASPEQLEDEAVDHRSDLYSLGVILFQLLTGRRPFEGNTLVDIVNAHRNASVPQLPLELHRYQAILDGLLAKDPDERFQSAAETLDGIDWVERGS